MASMTLGTFISEPTIVDPSDPISEIIGRMIGKRLNEVFVEEESRFGVITLRNILRAGEVPDRKASSLAVTPPVLIPNDSVSKAARIMSDLRVRSIPVLEQKGKLLGSVSSTTLLRELTRSASHGPAVSAIMTTRPVTLDWSDSLDKARSIMIERDFDHLPVTRNGKMTGLITSLDILTALGSFDRAGRSSKLPEPTPRGRAEVGGVLADAPNTSSPKDDSFKVLKSILAQDRTCSTILSDGMIQGIVTLRDFVRILALEPGRKGTPVYVVGLPEHDPESSLAEAKFRKSIESLASVRQGLEEARAIVKTSSLEKSRKRFEIQVLIRTERQQFDFTEEGWSIGDVFDRIAEKIRRLMTKPKDSPSRRRRLSREEIETSKYSG